MKNEKSAEITDQQIEETTDVIILQAENRLITDTIGTEEAIQQLKDSYLSLVSTKVEDLVGYKAVAEGIKKVKKILTSVEKKRVELNKPALKWQRDVNAKADWIKSELSPLVAQLIETKTKIDDAKAAMERELFVSRTTELAENAWQLANEFYICGAFQLNIKEISSMDEDSFKFYIQKGKEEIERREAEQKRKEEQDTALAEREAQLRDRERLLNEKMAELEKKTSELKAQSEALEKTYNKISDTVVDPLTVNPLQTNILQQAEELSNSELMVEFTPELDQNQEPEQESSTIHSMMAAMNPEDSRFDLPLESGLPSKSDVQDEFEAGFESCKTKIVARFESGDKLSREQWVEWIKSLEP